MEHADRGVTSTLGVVVLVAVTLIVAGTIGAFAFGVIEVPGEPAYASFEVVENDGFGAVEASARLKLEMAGGNAIDASSITVLVDGTPADSLGVSLIAPSTLEPGATVAINQSVAPGIEGGDTITLVREVNDEERILAEVTAKAGDIPWSDRDPALVFTSYAVGSMPGSPWSISGGANSQSTIVVDDTKAYIGDRSVKIHSDSTDDDSDRGQLSLQNLNLSKVDTIQYRLSDPLEDDDVRVNVGGDETQVGSTDGWATFQVDASSATGSQTVTFTFEEQTNDAAFTVWFDDVRFLDADGDVIPPEELR